MGLEIVLSERDLAEALTELEARLEERPGFYRGTPATAAFGTTEPTAEQFAELRRILDEGGIELRAVSGVAALEAIAVEQGVDYVSQAVDSEEFARRRALRPKRELKLSDAAKSLVADFAGARADIAERRKHGQTSVRRHSANGAPAGGAVTVPAEAPPAPPETLYHVGTLRGGQAIHHPGNIVVIGDVNPGTELVATGDIVIFGHLRGVAHAGAQGNVEARVYALRLDATQLRIATCIAAESGERTNPMQAEVALVRDGRIAVVPFERIDLPGVL
jgi:septum site-determining protein MinC